VRAAWVLVLCSCASVPPAEEAEALFQEASRLPVDQRERKLALLDRAIGLNPKPEYHTGRAVLRLLEGRKPEALEDLDRAAALGGPQARLNRALLRMDLGDAAGAKEDLDALLAEVPDHVEGRLQRARALRRLGKPGEAERDVAEARARGAALADAFYNEGVRSLTMGETAEADRQFGFALDLDAAHARAHVGRARILMERRRFEEAALHLDRAIAAQPGDAELYYHRGNARMAAGRGFEGLEDFERAAELEPGSAPFLAARGLARRLARSDLEGAKRDYDAAIRIDERCYAAWYNRGLLAQERGDLEEAERDLRAAVALRAQPEGNLALVRVLIDRGQVEQARSLVDRSLELYPDEEVKAVFRSERARLEQK
jgi:tetratricopeptide (TPR) repeat protein